MHYRTILDNSFVVTIFVQEVHISLKVGVYIYPCDPTVKVDSYLNNRFLP